jgi:hypothetical protein
MLPIVPLRFFFNMENMGLFVDAVHMIHKVVFEKLDTIFWGRKRGKKRLEPQGKLVLKKKNVQL